jgi:RsiW-degrading membrane proteinase PrsW (M82 family)
MENLPFILGVILPPLIYAFIIYLSSPLKSLNWKSSLKAIAAGVASVTVVWICNAFIPTWDTWSYLFDPFAQQFYVVAPKEELSKFIAFILVIGAIYKKGDYAHPISYMFYFAMVGLGFALIENVGYGQRYGMDVLYIRAFTATVTHMICGLLFGYWIGLGKIVRSKFQSRSLMGVWLENKPNIRSIIYTLMGFITAVSFHGLWNYNLTVSGKASEPIMIFLLFTGLIVSRLLFRDLITQYRKSIEKNKK